MSAENNFAKRLLNWYQNAKRDLPWRNTRDPYRIWLSEIILQQTRVEQGLPYYRRFTENYPTVQDLASAPEDEVMKLWEGLGYYSRARNLHASAKMVSSDMAGDFPDSSDGLRTLKGVGPYTANAIASFAFNEDVAVVDGNVYRVLSRIFNISTPINSSKGKTEFQELANTLLPKGNSADFNQAMMEFGALQCKPNPNCMTCPFADICQARALDRIAALPVKEKKQAKRERYLNYLLVHDGRNTLLQKRTEKDIWLNLHQFPLFESGTDHLPIDQLINAISNDYSLSISDLIVDDTWSSRHILSHQILHVKVWITRSPHALNGSSNDGIFEASLDDVLKKYALPVVLKRFVEEKYKDFVSQ